MTNAIGALPILVAQDEKFFQRHGLTVDAQPVANLGLIPSTLGKTYDIGITVGPIMISAAASGIPLVAISGNEIDSSKAPQLAIMTRDDIKTPQDLKGKRMATPTLQGNFNLATKHWLAKEGVDPNTMKYVQVANPNMIQQLKAGVVDAIQVQPPFIALAVQAGFRNLGDPILTLGDPIQDTYYIALRDWATAHSKEAVGFRDALGDAMQWIAAHPDDAYAKASAFTKVDANLVKNIPLNYFSTDFDAAGLQQWGEVMKEQGGFKGDLDYNSLIFSGK